MKKITLFISLMISSLGFSQVELITNGTFDTTNNWALSGPGTNAIVGGVAGFSATNDAGNPWDTQLVQGNLSFTTGASYSLTFTAASLTTARTIKVAIQNVGFWDAQTPNPDYTYSLTTIPQTFTLNFNAASTNANVQVGFLMGAQGSTDGVYFDNVSLMGPAPVVVAGPTTAALTPPARLPGEVISLFSNAYTNIGITNWSAAWDDSSYTDEFSVPGDNIKKITFGNFLGVELANYEDATSMTYFHMDYYIPAGTDLTGKVLNPKLSNHAAMAGETNSLLLTHLPTVAGSWVSLDVPLASFSPQGPGVAFAREKLREFLISSNIGTVYVDNIYLHKNTFLSNSNFEDSKVKMYPNPAANVLNINANSVVENVSIYTLLGQEVLSKEVNSNEVALDVSSLQAGVYIVKTSVDGKISSSRFIKE